MKSRTFAYNSTGSTFSNFKLTGNLSYTRQGDGAPSEYEIITDTEGLYLWGGPDEDQYYIISYPQPNGDHPTPVAGKTASLGFKGSDKNDSAFIDLVNSLSGGTFTTLEECKKWLNKQGYWSSHGRWFDWKVNAGYNSNSIGVDYNGQVWCWGINTNGQSGTNNTIQYTTPTSILGTKKTFCSINGGYNYSLGVDNNGQAWGWGYNDYGQLGAWNNTKTPVMINI